MARYARIENGVAVEVIDTADYAIEQLFAPAFVAAMVRVPDGTHVEIGAAMAEHSPVIEPSQETPIPVADKAVAVGGSEPLASERTWRQSVLAATEWQVTRHRDEQELGRGTSLGAQQYLALLEYRQALRDWPGSDEFATAHSRPTAPQWLTESLG
jgi:hypothetical protein